MWIRLTTSTNHAPQNTNNIYLSNKKYTFSYHVYLALENTTAAKRQHITFTGVERKWSDMENHIYRYSEIDY